MNRRMCYETIKKKLNESVKNGEKTTGDYREILHLIKIIKNKEDPGRFFRILGRTG